MNQEALLFVDPSRFRGIKIVFHSSRSLLPANLY